MADIVNAGGGSREEENECKENEVGDVGGGRRMVVKEQEGR